MEHWFGLSWNLGHVAEVFSIGRNAAWLLCGLPHRHWHEVRLGEACIVVGVVGVVANP